jgi:hypothetical protein
VLVSFGLASELSKALKRCRANLAAADNMLQCFTLTWVLKESIIQRLSVFERKILRKIFGPTKVDNSIWRIKTNMELDELIKHWNIINYVKSQRLSWFGHINRMLETSVVKKIYT